MVSLLHTHVKYQQTVLIKEVLAIIDKLYHTLAVEKKSDTQTVRDLTCVCSNETITTLRL